MAAGYHLFAAFSGVRKLFERRRSSTFTPPVSILKPVRGADYRFVEAITSHATQNYPEFEILFGISDANDPARVEIAQLIEAYPAVPIRLFAVATDAPNMKVGVLELLAAQARHPILVVNDSDILVDPDYLREVVAPLAEPSVGVVTCLYRGSGASFATRSEGLGIATEFAPSVLVARQVGVKEFAMGSTLAFRARDLQRIGGFHAIRDYLADDYQLGKRLTALGLGVVLARPVVETSLGAGDWSAVWKHQVRWSRTIRVSRTGGYFGYVITHAILWCTLAALTGNVTAGLVCYLVRVICGLLIAGAVMRDSNALRFSPFLPVRDLFGFAVWVAGLFGRTVEWRGQQLQIDPSGRIVVIET